MLDGKKNRFSCLALLITLTGILCVIPHTMAVLDRPHVMVSDITSLPSVFAGDVYNFSITLTNVGGKTAQGVRLTLDIKYPFALVNSSSNIFIGQLRKNEDAHISVKVSIDRKALVGLYYSTFEVLWEDSVTSYNQPYQFNVQVLGRPKIDIQETIINQNQSKLTAGERFVRTIRLTNVGLEEANTVQIDLNISWPFALTGSSSNFLLGDLGVGDNSSISIEISVDRNAVGVYSIPFAIYYEDSYGWPYLHTRSFGVEVFGKPKMLISEVVTDQDKSNVFTGESFVKVFNLTNIGTFETKRVQLSLDVSYPFALTSSSTNLLFGSIETDESIFKLVEFSVDREALVGVYSIPYTIGYENPYGDEYEKTGLFGVKVLGKPMILFDEISTEPSTLKGGSNGLLDIRLTNIGADVAHDTYIRISGGKRILSNSFAYLAKIDAKKSESLIFPLKIDQKLETGTHLLNITISYRGYLNNTYLLSRLYELTVTTNKSFFSPFYINASAVIVVLSLIGYFVYTWQPEKPDDAVEVIPDKSKLRTNILQIVVVIGICMMIFPLPYVVHNTLDNAGIVISSEDISLSSLPQQIQEICILRGISKPVLMMIKHVKPEVITMLISSSKYPVGTAVEMTDFIIEWHVDWRDFNLAEQAFQKFSISNIEELGYLETMVEKILFEPELFIGVYSLSKATFFGGPILFILCLTLGVQKRLALWNLPALFGIYSYQIWSQNLLAFKHNLTIATEMEKFGYLFFGLIPLSLYAWHFEKSKGGEPTAKKLKALSQILGLVRE